MHPTVKTLRKTLLKMNVTINERLSLATEWA